MFTVYHIIEDNMKKLFVLLIVLLSIAALPASSDLGGGHRLIS